MHALNCGVVPTPKPGERTPPEPIPDHESLANLLGFFQVLLEWDEQKTGADSKSVDPSDKEAA